MDEKDDDKVFVSLEMPAEMKEEVERVAKQLGINRSAWIRTAIIRQLKINAHAYAPRKQGQPPAR